MTHPEAEENFEATWTPLLESVNAMEAEMLRGYLETQGIPVQLRISKQGLSFMRGRFWAEAPFRYEDIYVPQDLWEAAAAILEDMPEQEPIIGDDDDFVLVYDEDGELQELDLSPGGKCPACGGESLVYEVPKGGSFGLIATLWLVYILSVSLLFKSLSDYLSEGMAIILLTFFVAILLFFTLPHLQRQSEKWYCYSCNKHWHK